MHYRPTQYKIGLKIKGASDILTTEEMPKGSHGIAPIEEDVTEKISFSPVPQTYTATAKDVSFSYVQTDALQRLDEDLKKIHKLKNINFDVFSWAMGIAPTALIAMVCDWDSTKISFKVYAVAFVISVIIGLLSIAFRKSDSDPAVINERILTVQKDLECIFSQSNASSNQESGSSTSDS